MNEVSQRIARVKTIFLDTQSFCAKQDDMEPLLQYLESTEPAFRSIAYESASMAIALKDLNNGDDLNGWLSYAKGPALAHKTQVYVGLGLAIAQLNSPLLPILQKIEPLFYHRVADGCGYYDGSFRHRRTVLSQELPGYLPGPLMPFYDQGIGRSLWYTGSGDVNKISNWINSFPVDRKASLWRGIGIAVAYVGGYDKSILENLFRSTGTNAIELAHGAALAARSRREANTLTTDTDECSRFWYSLTAGKEDVNETGYLNWITQVEEGLAKSFSID